MEGLKGRNSRISFAANFFAFSTLILQFFERRSKKLAAGDTTDFKGVNH
jgi:hypothetical protein